MTDQFAWSRWAGETGEDALPSPPRGLFRTASQLPPYVQFLRARSRALGDQQSSTTSPASPSSPTSTSSSSARALAMSNEGITFGGGCPFGRGAAARREEPQPQLEKSASHSESLDEYESGSESGQTQAHAEHPPLTYTTYLKVCLSAFHLELTPLPCAAPCAQLRPQP